MTDSNKFIYKGFISGSSIIIAQLSGHLLLDNMKMEKQRTDLPYIKIFNNFRSKGIRGYLSGFLPWGVLLGYGKGFIVGGVSYKIKRYCNDNNISGLKVPIYSGIISGFSEALFMNPIMMARNNVNKYMIDSKKNVNFRSEINISSKILYKKVKNKGILSIYKGASLLILRRSLDWSSRFLFVDLFQNFVKKNNNINELNNFQYLYTTMLGSAITTPITTPIDRILPILYTNNKNESIKILKSRIKKDGIKSLFRGLLFRSISTGYYTMFLFCLPKIFL